MMGVHDLKLKVDTAASDNTMPIRIATDMCGNQWQSKAEPAKHTTLKAYSGGQMLWDTEHPMSVQGLGMAQVQVLHR